MARPKRRKNQNNKVTQRKTILQNNRRNYLFQLANCCVEENNLSRFYIQEQIWLSQKLTQRNEPLIKRSVCKGCKNLLIPGITACVRITNGHKNNLLIKRVTITCQICHRIKRFNLPLENTDNNDIVHFEENEKKIAI
eukprot:TRINITY_DN3465_c0_g1_i1.p1 TRINITY_DN3465_c0_g1~~TRINITY_DN3465_c0_g1_i1.p1  ORF type:complete len:138 (+),score=29.15 TRINITY_DN3465_c0_g1_i1:83-496(+)